MTQKDKEALVAEATNLLNHRRIKLSPALDQMARYWGWSDKERIKLAHATPLQLLQLKAIYRTALKVDEKFCALKTKLGMK